MPVPNTYAVLRDSTNWIQEQYFDELIQQDVRPTLPELRLFDWMPEKEMSGDGLTFQVELGFMDGARAGRLWASSPSFPTPRAFTDDKVKFRWNADDRTQQDFCILRSSVRVRHDNIVNGGKGVVVDAAKKLIKDAPGDLDWKSAVMANCRQTGALATISSTPKQGARSYSAATATITANSQGATIQVAGGRIARFKAGAHIDIYDGSTAKASNVEVISVNIADDSMWVRYNTTTDDASSGSLLTSGGIASGNTIYFSGNGDFGGLNNGMIGEDEWMSTPTSGENFVGGKDRTTSPWLSPHFLNEDSALGTVVDENHFHAVADVVDLEGVTDPQFVCTLPTKTLSTLRQRFGRDALITVKQDGMGERNWVMGANAVYFMHPTLGKIEIVASRLQTPSTMRFYNRPDWMRVHWNERTEWYPGDPAMGGKWYREQDASPNSGKGVTYRADVERREARFCKRPKGSAAVVNVGP